MIEPLFWYWSTTWVDEVATVGAAYEQHDRPSSKQTAWVLAMMDFTFATGEIVALAGVDGHATSITTRARMFSSATNNLFKRFNVELFTAVKDSLQLTTLACRSIPRTT